MRNFVISDIHGDNEGFRKALKSVKLKKQDNLYLLGDVIDRGRDTKDVLDTILLLREHGFNVVCLKGNHEEMFLQALTDKDMFNLWIKNGGDKTLESFLTSSIHKIPNKYIDLISSFIDYYEVLNYILVHAAINMNISNPFDDKRTLLWERNPLKYYKSDWLKDKIMIHGHSPVNREHIENSIRRKENIINIDNGSFLNREGFGSVCILQLENLNIKFSYESN